MIHALRNSVLALSLLAVIVSAADKTRLAGIYVKDGNQNGQLRFLASGLTSSSSSSTSGSNSLNAALNQYITNKQDMLEQLRPTTSSSGTGLTSVTGTSGNSNAIYVNLASGTVNSGTGGSTVTSATGGTTGTGTTGTGTGSSSSSSNSNSNTQAALNQVIYGSSPINALLPQIIGEAVSQRRRPGNNNNNNNRRRVVQRRRPANNNNNNRRRRRKGNNKGKNGNKRPQVMVVRPIRG